MTAATQPLHVVEDAGPAAALLHPLRLRLLQELAEPDSAAGLARRLGQPRQQLNYHLRQLEEQGLIEEVGVRQRRGCTERLLRGVARSYLISPATLGAVAADPAQVPDRLSSAYLVAVAAQVIRDVAGLGAGSEAAGRRVPTLTLQTEIRFANAATRARFARELSRAVARLAARYHDERAPGGRRFRVVAGAYPAPPGSPSRSPSAPEAS
jgi:DNA-binding transcriptional ArsR family regulator